jgi:DNA-binding SARP family transcriptional activator/basic membrane lipoprotein Med (substrate-binding protein (PBP1-ABC) superfamily)
MRWAERSPVPSQATRRRLAQARNALARGSNGIPKRPETWFATDVTRERQRLEIGVLGSLTVVRDGVEVPLGGAKQRAVLAILLLRAGEIVSVERLVDDVWGDSPPPSAAHSLEAYVSRLRQLFGRNELTVARRGTGYRLELGHATLDARAFERLADDAFLAAAAGEHERVADLAAEALSLWRGPALADVALASPGRADAERLEELRLRLLEQRFDAELALGRHEGVVGELQMLAAQNPYRERLVGQLMLALYRSGRQADALEAYERTRAALDRDLGLQPSEELRALSGRIVRQEPELRRPLAPAVPRPRRPKVERRAGRLSGLVLAGVTTAAVTALAAHGSAPLAPRQQPEPARLAVVLPGSKGSKNHVAERFLVGLSNAALLDDLRTQTLFLGENGAAGGAERVARRIRSNGVGIVVVLGDGASARALASHVQDLPDRRFLFVDASLRDLALDGVQNASALRFADEESSYLLGYMGGLAAPRDGSASRVDTVSVVAGLPTAHTKRLVAAFRQGARDAARDVEVRVDYAGELDDRTACEQLANRQIDDGSDVVFAVAGRCGLGAMAVARYRGVWSIGTDDLGVSSSPHVLAVSGKEWERDVMNTVLELAEGTLPHGRDRVLGLAADYAVTLDLSRALPERVASAVMDRCTEIRSGRHRVQ